MIKKMGHKWISNLEAASFSTIEAAPFDNEPKFWLLRLISSLCAKKSCIRKQMRLVNLQFETKFNPSVLPPLC
jgi:hypothetical protein